MSSVVMVLATHLPKRVPFWVLPLLILPTAVLAWRWAQLQPRRLRWDGQSWWLHDERGSLDEFQVQIEVLFDLGACLLLCARPVPTPSYLRRLFPAVIYLPLAQSGQSQWHHLRACLYAAPHDHPEHSGL
ncbi:hypothetical protein [Paucibacter sp. Y2R2-4]|uniref:hypothetical protein n=1 Tax=Paucibacter sp. Y2R2-4 TaxID=2893553 RepID=UPI0021E48C70|nr:hypothetical protein [Paucibacter sp. Y2R2-4]MCV2349714.1 hypothetical protein [Paucibacter sp. Y2R2-4]